MAKRRGWCSRCCFLSFSCLARMGGPRLRRRKVNSKLFIQTQKSHRSESQRMKLSPGVLAFVTEKEAQTLRRRWRFNSCRTTQLGGGSLFLRRRRNSLEWVQISRYRGITTACTRPRIARPLFDSLDACLVVCAAGDAGR